MAVNKQQIEAEALRRLNAEGIGIVKTQQRVGDAASIAIVSWSKDKIKIVQDILLKRGTGSLGQSVAPMPIKQDGDKYVIEITADDYADFVDKGVNGLIQSHASPYSFRTPFPSRGMISSLMDWNKTTGRTVPDQAHPGIKSYEQLAFATARNVKKYGIKPSHFMEKAFGEESEKELAQALEIALGRAVEINFTAIAKTYNKK